MAPKDEAEMSTEKKACQATCDIYNKYLKQQIIDVVDAEKVSMVNAMIWADTAFCNLLTCENRSGINLFQLLCRQLWFWKSSGQILIVWFFRNVNVLMVREDDFQLFHMTNEKILPTTTQLHVRRFLQCLQSWSKRKRRELQYYLVSCARMNLLPIDAWRHEVLHSICQQNSGLASAPQYQPAEILFLIWFIAWNFFIKEERVRKKKSFGGMNINFCW